MKNNTLEKTNEIELKQKLKQLVNDYFLNIVKQEKNIAFYSKGQLVIIGHFTSIELSEYEMVQFINHGKLVMSVSKEVFKDNFKFEFYSYGKKFYSLDL